jgi:hypothetical protein
MPASVFFFLADLQHARLVEVQGSNRRAACCGQAKYFQAVPTKVLLPVVTARMKEIDNFPGIWIFSNATSAFAQGITNACQAEVVFCTHPFVGARHDVIDMKSGDLTFLRQATILAAVPGASDDQASQPFGNAAHERGRRCCPLRSARSRKRLNISASSTRPSASRRSALDKLPWSSCLSSSWCKRRSSALGKRNCFRSPGNSTCTTTWSAMEPPPNRIAAIIAAPRAPGH